jgi:hypothetical protein
MKPSVYRAKAEALFGDKSAEEMQAMADELSDGTTPEIALTRTAFTRLVAAAMEQGFKDGRTDRRKWLDSAVVH